MNGEKGPSIDLVCWIILLRKILNAKRILFFTLDIQDKKKYKVIPYKLLLFINFYGNSSAHKRKYKLNRFHSHTIYVQSLLLIQQSHSEVLFRFCVKQCRIFRFFVLFHKNLFLFFSPSIFILCCICVWVLSPCIYFLSTFNSL